MESGGRSAVTVSSDRRALFRSSSDGAACFVALAGFALLAGWLFDIPALKYAPRGTIIPKANVAAGFILCGASLWLSGRKEMRRWIPSVGEAFAGLAAILGALTLCEHLFGWELGIDQILAREAAGAVNTLSPGRMAPNAAFNLTLLGISLVLLQRRRGGTASAVLTFAAGAVSILGLMGYAYAVETTHGFVAATTIAFQTALIFLILSAGVLIALGNRGLVPVLDGATAGGAMAQVLLPAVIVILPVLGWLRLEGERRGFFSEGVGFALMVTLAVLFLVVVVLRNAGTINRADISRIRAEETVRRAAAYNRSLIEASLDLLVTISADGKVTDVNAATERVTGYPREALVGTDFSDYFTEPGKARAGYKQVFREGAVQDYPLEVRRRDGHVTPVLYNAAVYRDESGSVIGVFAAARDVTDRKRAEEALERRTEELARSNADLERFAYVASHDLQEPLRMVSSYVQLLARRYEGKLDSDADEFIRFAVDGAGRMQRLITDLLAFSRVGRQGKEFESTSLETALDRALLNLQMAIEESGAVVTHDPMPVVQGDLTQLVQVFQNLVGNAIKFRGKEPPRVDVSIRRNAGDWLLSVRDNGIGVEAQYSDRIFLIFQRLHGREYPGTGIGLPISRKIVERHGGRMWVESEPGKGSTFFFTLPRHRDREPDNAPKSASSRI
jgi:PAS domain S-box-containing protein